MPLAFNGLYAPADARRATARRRYGWLAYYNVIYILPLLAITLVFTFTLGARKLSEAEGRFLKLVSGLMMFGLGLLLVLSRRCWMSNTLVSLPVAMDSEPH